MSKRAHGILLEAFRDGLNRADEAWVVTAVVPGKDGTPDTLVCDVVGQRDVVVSQAAAEFAKRRGGRIYVWADRIGEAAGWLKASTEDPGPSGSEYERRRVDRVEVFVAKDVLAPRIKVRLSVSRHNLVAEWPEGPTARVG